MRTLLDGAGAGALTTPCGPGQGRTPVAVEAGGLQGTTCSCQAFLRLATGASGTVSCACSRMY